MSEAYSPSGYGRRGGVLGHRKKASEQSTPTSWRRRREGQIKIWKESN